MYLSKFSQVVARASMSGLAGAAKGNAGFRARYTLPDLPYDYAALEPVISADIMKLHHMKHHATYVQNLNQAEEKMVAALQKGDLKSAIELQGVMKFNGGGHINHSIFWQNLSPDGGKEPTGTLQEAIKRDFGDFESLKKLISQTATQVQGSGWAWLGYNKQAKRLQVAQCANQDPLEATTGLVPLLGVDVWEHAYYLQYKNVRADYVKELWNIINWKDVEERFAQANSSAN
ncbi:Superoxide dismutase [Mn], mitochondrial [Hypsibius exemplaris]|uniref:Superoxide dismutase n=1 Tax=Hypsibius exemplaris TaxID=2072580 RepID=A0A1W0X6V7_HYPEX|nr:Superoxide dismutase [Mn], mitochondrial [Hypsibius exemplaris]